MPQRLVGPRFGGAFSFNSGLRDKNGPTAVLKILAAWPDGISESMLRAHGVQSTLLGELIGAQLATAKVERFWEDGQELELTRIRITGKGRLKLER